MSLTLEIAGVSKRYGSIPALANVSLTIPFGEKVLLLGANSSGKSTLLRTVAGLVKPDSGTVRLSTEVPVSTKQDRALDRLAIGYVGHELQLYGPLTVRENLELEQGLIGSDVSEVDAMLAHWDLGKVANRPLADLSRGMKVRTALARATLRKPKILLLDEPTSGLDERSAKLLFSTVHDHQGTVMIVTHDLFRLRPLATRVVVLGGGQIVSDSAQATLEATFSSYYESNA